MATIKQIRANRRNAKKSQGPKTQAGKDRVKFNALVHGRRAESTILPGEDRAKFDQLLKGLHASWLPQDEMENSLVEQIAVNQWKLARLDRSEGQFYVEGALTPAEFALAIHRVHLTEARLERCVSNTIADLERYRKERVERIKAATPKGEPILRGGLIWVCNGKESYSVLPKIRGLDGVWREIPREIMGDFPDPSHPAA